MNTLPKPEIFNAASLEEEIAEVTAVDTYAPTRPRVGETRSVRRLNDRRDSPSASPEQVDDSATVQGDNTTMPPEPETEHSAFYTIMRGTTDRVLLTFIEVDGYPILRESTLRIGEQTEVKDLVLNNDQIKLLLRQMTLWLTR